MTTSIDIELFKKMIGALPFADENAGIIETQKAMYAAVTEIERLKAQLAASEEKRKVLGAECQAWRKAWQDVPCSKPECSICLSTKATDAVSALEGT